MTVAQELTGARESQNLTVNEVARATRINAALIEAIESEDYGRFSAAFYARGCVRNLARFYRLDHRRIKKQFVKELPSTPLWRPNSSRTDTSRDETDSWCYWIACMRLDGLVPWLLILALMACLLGAYTLGHAHGTQSAEITRGDGRFDISNGEPLAARSDHDFTGNELK